MKRAGRSSLGKAAARMLPVLALLLMMGGKMEAAEVRVSALGAIPNDGKDDTLAVRAAIEACGKSGARLVFEPGRYDLKADTKRQSSLAFQGVDGLTIEGNGAEIVGSTLATAFSFGNCKNVVIRNLTIDWDPLPFTAGTVVAVGEKQFDLEVVAPHTVQAGRPVQGVLGYDPERRRLAYRGLDVYQMDSRIPSEEVRPGVLRCFVSRPSAVPKVGAPVVVRHQIYAFNGFGFSNCEGVTLEDVTIYACPGMGLHAGRGRDFTLRRFRVLPRPGAGRWMSATADATHFNACRGTVTLEDCFFEGMGDDATNIHSMYMVVTERVDERTVRLAQGRQPRGLPAIPLPGDCLEFGGGENPLAPYATAIVESAEADPVAKVAVVRFREALPERVAKEDVVGNTAALPAARIRRCQVVRNRARGMLIQTRDVILEDCFFEDVSGAALHICADANYWWEGMGVRNVVIRNNRFRRCDFGAARRNSVIDIFAEVGKSLAGPGVHRGVTIEGNHIEDADGAAIHIGSAEGVTIRNNTIVRPTDAAITVRNSRDVQITGNKLTEGTVGVRLDGGGDPATVKASDNAGFGPQ